MANSFVEHTTAKETSASPPSIILDAIFGFRQTQIYDIQQFNSWAL